MRIEEDFIDIGRDNIFLKRIEVSSFHNNPTIIFLHDALGCTDSFRDFPEVLCDAVGSNGFLFDRAGHGRSSSYTDQRDCDYLKREAEISLPSLLRAFGISGEILLGHSDGATIALLRASNHNTVEAVISLAGHFMVEEVTRQGVSKTARELSSNSQLSKLKKLHGNKAEKLLGDWSGIWLSESFRSWNIGPDLRKINCPSLIIQGSDDKYATVKHATGMANEIGDNAVVEILADCGHFPYRDKPDVVINLIRNFLKRST